MAGHPAAISWVTLAGHVADSAVNGGLGSRKFDSIQSRGNPIKPHKTPQNQVVKRAKIKNSSNGQKLKIAQNSFKKEKNLIKPNKTL